MKKAESKTPELHYYDWSLTRWFTSDTHDILDATGRGIYRELLDRCYGQGRIPNNEAILARMCRATDEQFAAVWTLIKHHFPADKNSQSYRRNSQADAFRSSYFRYKKTQTKRGSAGGTAKSKSARAVKSTESNDMPSTGLATASEVRKPEPSQKETLLHYTPRKETSVKEISNGAIAPEPETERAPTIPFRRSNSVLPIMAEDDGFADLRREVEKRIPEFTFTVDDWCRAYPDWCALAPDQRPMARQNYLDRIDVGENLTYLKPQMILRGKEWQRIANPGRASPRKPRGGDAFDRLLGAEG